MGARRSLSDLEERVRVLEAEREERLRRDAVLARLLTYSRCIDAGDEAGWVACFTADGIFDVRSTAPGYTPRRVVGAAELAAFIAAHTAPPAVHHKHLYLMPEIDLGEREARAIGYIVHLVDHERRPELQAFGRYLDRLVPGANGDWLIAERLVEIEATTGAQR